MLHGTGANSKAPEHECVTFSCSVKVGCITWVHIKDVKETGSCLLSPPHLIEHPLPVLQYPPFHPAMVRGLCTRTRDERDYGSSPSLMAHHFGLELWSLEQQLVRTQALSLPKLSPCQKDFLKQHPNTQHASIPTRWFLFGSCSQENLSKGCRVSIRAGTEDISHTPSGSLTDHYTLP